MFFGCSRSRKSTKWRFIEILVLDSDSSWKCGDFKIFDYRDVMHFAKIMFFWFKHLTLRGSAGYIPPWGGSILKISSWLGRVRQQVWAFLLSTRVALPESSIRSKKYLKLREHEYKTCLVQRHFWPFGIKNWVWRLIPDLIRQVILNLPLHLSIVLRFVYWNFPSVSTRSKVDIPNSGHHWEVWVHLRVEMCWRYSTKQFRWNKKYQDVVNSRIFKI